MRNFEELAIYADYLRSLQKPGESQLIEKYCEPNCRGFFLTENRVLVISPYSNDYWNYRGGDDDTREWPNRRYQQIKDRIYSVGFGFGLEYPYYYLVFLERFDWSRSLTDRCGYVNQDSYSFAISYWNWSDRQNQLGRGLGDRYGYPTRGYGVGPSEYMEYSRHQIPYYAIE